MKIVQPFGKPYVAIEIPAKVSFRLLESMLFLGAAGVAGVACQAGPQLWRRS